MFYFVLYAQKKIEVDGLYFFCLVAKSDMQLWILKHLKVLNLLKLKIIQKIDFWGVKRDLTSN